MPTIEMTLGAFNRVHCFPSHNDDVDFTRNKLSSSTATVTVLCLIQLELCDRPGRLAEEACAPWEWLGTRVHAQQGK